MSNIGALSFSRSAQELMKHRQVTAKEQDSFASILEKTRSISPQQAKETLQALSVAERELLEQVHFGSALHSSLDTPAQIDALSDEGAYNLLVQPHSYVDIDRDGITDVGKGKTLIFPPSDSSREVKDAWDAATEGLTPLQKATQEMKMHVRLFGIAHDGVSSSNQGAAGYADAIEHQLSFLEQTRGQIPAEVYVRDKDFLERFLAALSEAAKKRESLIAKRDASERRLEEGQD